MYFPKEVHCSFNKHVCFTTFNHITDVLLIFTERGCHHPFNQA